MSETRGTIITMGCLFCFFLGLGLSSPSSSGAVSAGIQEYRDLEYERAISLLEAALARPDLSPDDRILALSHLARAHAALGQIDPATEYFCELLALSPEFTVSSRESLRMQNAFRAAQEQMRKATPKTASEKPSPPPPNSTEPPSTDPPREDAPISAAPSPFPQPTTPPPVAPDSSPSMWSSKWFWLGAAGVLLTSVGISVALASRPKPAADRAGVAVIGTVRLP